MQDLIDKEDCHDRLITKLDTEYNLDGIDYENLSSAINNAIDECVDYYSKTFIDEDGNIEIDDWDMLHSDITNLVLKKLDLCD